MPFERKVILGIVSYTVFLSVHMTRTKAGVLSSSRYTSPTLAQQVQSSAITPKYHTFCIKPTVNTAGRNVKGNNMCRELQIEEGKGESS